MTETKEKDVILENLNYIGLDLKNLPDFLKNYEEIDYKPTTICEQKEFKVYKYINLKNIQILLTPAHKNCSITEKYSKAQHISEYLKEDNSNLFLESIGKLDKKEINKIDEEQKLAKNKVPFRVEYETSELWEIYYSSFTGKYFMMVSLETLNNSALFYLLKKQIECFKTEKEEMLYVPIKHLDYTKRYLNEVEISEVEKYIWLFTKEWPRVYEIFDKDNELTIHIVGDTSVYDNIKSFYKIELKTKEEAIKFYNFLKNLFVLKAELPTHYNFDTQINEKGELTFEFNNKLITYNNLSKFIKEEYKKQAEILQEVLDEKEKIDIELEKIKEEELEKNKEYIFRERQVTTYLACRKSIFGKIKYFFNNKNSKFSKQKEKKYRTDKVKEQNEIEKSITNAIIEEKEYYSIEDLVKICIELDRINFRIKNAKLDIRALKEKIKTITQKINNAAIFIQTIEEHKKSIFEFWKFSNKDLPLGLNSGTEVEQEIIKKEEQEEKNEKYIYLCSIDKLSLTDKNTFYFNPIEAINSIQEEKISLSKIKLTVPMEVLENQKTIEIDLNNYKIDLKKQKIFRINCEEEKFDFKEKIICVYEYELKQKEE